MRFSLVVQTILLGGAVVLSGCSGVHFTREGSDFNEGFLYYPPKPYLVVQKTKDGTTAQVISLPDLANPRRVKHVARLGTAEMGFDLQNGIITKFNSKSDSKTAETITAVGTGALGAVGGAYAGILTAGAAVKTAEAALREAEGEAAASDDGAFTIEGIQEAQARIDATIDALSAESPLLERLEKARATLPEATFEFDDVQDWRAKMDSALEKVTKAIFELRDVRQAVHERLTNGDLPPTAAEAREELDEALRALTPLVDTFEITALVEAKRELEGLLGTIGAPAFDALRIALREEVAVLVPYESIPLVDGQKTLSTVGAALEAAEKDAVRVARRLERRTRALASSVPDAVKVPAASARETLADVAADLRKFAAGGAGPSVEVYEIVADGDSIDFRRVVFD